MATDTASELVHSVSEAYSHNEARRIIVDGDPQSTVTNLAELALDFNRIVIEKYGGLSGGEREEGIIESVIAPAFQTYGGQDPYPTPFDKAAVMFRGITGGHTCMDANNRTGFLLSAAYLDECGIKFPDQIDVEEVFLLCNQIALGNLREIDDISSKLRSIWTNNFNAQA